MNATHTSPADRTEQGAGQLAGHRAVHATAAAATANDAIAALLEAGVLDICDACGQTYTVATTPQGAQEGCPVCACTLCYHPATMTGPLNHAGECADCRVDFYEGDEDR